MDALVEIAAWEIFYASVVKRWRWLMIFAVAILSWCFCVSLMFCISFTWWILSLSLHAVHWLWNI